MSAIIISSVIICVSTSVLNLILFFKKSYQKKPEEKEEAKEKDSIDKIFDKFVIDENKDLMKEKLSEISKIVKKAEDEVDEKVRKKIKIAVSHYRATHKESKQISKAGKQYDSFESRLNSAMPKSEEELLKDMDDLKSAISILESYDKEPYNKVPKRQDPGIGIFYDKMARQFKSLIDEQKLFKYLIVPIQRLKYYAFLSILNIKDSDIIPILKVMKETKLINDIIDINPSFQVIKFSDIELNLSFAEKVLLSLAYDEDLMTKEKLIDLTEWTAEYVNKTIKSLVDKGLATILDDKIIVGGFGQYKDRIDWKTKIEEIIGQEKTKEEEKVQRQTEKKEKLKQQLSKVEKEELSKLKGKRESKTKDEKSKKVQEIKDKDALVGVMEALDDIMPTKSKLEKSNNQTSELSLEDLVPEKILNYHESFSIVNGGFVQYDKLKEFLNSEIENVPENLIKSVLEKLIMLQMIHNSIKIGEKEFYLFNKLRFNEDEKMIIQISLDNNPQEKKFYDSLKWEEERILKAMKSLQKKGILRIENNKIIIPGIIQKKS